MKALNLVNHKFGDLTVLSKTDPYISPSGKTRKVRWLCKCSCSNTTKVPTGDLKSGNTTSCGCKSSRTTMGKRHGFKPTHNMSNHKLYSVWNNMNERCNNPKNTGYKHYGAAGVTVCPEWHKNNPNGLLNFINDMEPTYQEGLVIDKDIIGNGLLYSKNTCAWVTPKDNARKTKRVKLSLKLAQEIRSDKRSHAKIAEDLGVGKTTIRHVKQNNTWT